MSGTDAKSRSLLSLGALFCAAVFLALALVGIVVPRFFGIPSDPGVFGDMFGVANALFSGLAFVGVILAILLQRQELSLQRQELEATREEMALARQESARSAHATELAARLSALSQLIAYHKSNADRFAQRAFDQVKDSNAPGGVRAIVIDERAKDQFKEHHDAHELFIVELKRVYTELLRSSGKPAA